MATSAASKGKPTPKASRIVAPRRTPGFRELLLSAFKAILEPLNLRLLGGLAARWIFAAIRVPGDNPSDGVLADIIDLYTIIAALCVFFVVLTELRDRIVVFLEPVLSPTRSWVHWALEKLVKR